MSELLIIVIVLVVVALGVGLFFLLKNHHGSGGSDKPGRLVTGFLALGTAGSSGEGVLGAVIDHAYKLHFDKQGSQVTMYYEPIAIPKQDVQYLVALEGKEETDKLVPIVPQDMLPKDGHIFHVPCEVSTGERDCVMLVGPAGEVAFVQSVPVSALTRNEDASMFAASTSLKIPAGSVSWSV